MGGNSRPVKLAFAVVGVSQVELTGISFKAVSIV